jgi:WD40 repeat protein
MLKAKAPSGMRDFSVCRNEFIFLALVYDTVHIYSTDFFTPLLTVRLDSIPRSAKISTCGKYFFVHDFSNIISLYDIRSGVLIQQIFGAPPSTKTIKFSKNLEKVIFGSTQMICIWNVWKCTIDMRTDRWKNINVYNLNDDGSQFALGTYNGTVYVMEQVELGKYNQIQIARHKTCVAAICCHKNQVISASHDGLFLISTI